MPGVAVEVLWVPVGYCCSVVHCTRSPREIQTRWEMPRNGDCKSEKALDNGGCKSEKALDNGAWRIDT